jgi:hypothetical protein
MLCECIFCGSASLVGLLMPSAGTVPIIRHPLSAPPADSRHNLSPAQLVVRNTMKIRLKIFGATALLPNLLGRSFRAQTGRAA